MAEISPIPFLCSVCGEGGVLFAVRMGPMRQEGDHVVVPLLIGEARCDHCGTEYRTGMES